MNETIKKDILSILSETISILGVKEEKDVIEMRELINHTIHTALSFRTRTRYP